MGPLAVLFGLAISVWMVPILRTGRMLPMIAIALITGVVFGPACFSIDGPIQISADRVLLGTLIGVAALRWRVGSLALSKPMRLDWMILVWTAYVLVSSLRGGDVPGVESPLARWIFFLFIPICFYGLARQVRLGDREVRWLEMALLVMGVYLSITAVLEVMGQRVFVFPRHINDPSVEEFFGRGRGPLLNPIVNGMLITLSLTVAAVRFCTNPLRRRWIYAVIVAVMMAGVYCSKTRSVWIGAIAALGIVGLVYLPRWVRVLGLAMAVLMAGGMMLGLKDQLLAMKRDKALSAAEAAKSVELRPLLAIVAYEMFKDRPIVGHGYGHYFEHSPPYHTQRQYGLPLENVRPYIQHNIFLSVLVDTGLLGLSAFLVILATIAGAAWRLVADRDRSRPGQMIGFMMLGYLATYVCNGMFHEVGVIEMVHAFLFALAGMTISGYQNGTESANQQRISQGDPGAPDRRGHATQDEIRAPGLARTQG